MPANLLSRRTRRQLKPCMAPDPSTFRCSYALAYEAESDAPLDADVLAHIRFGSETDAPDDPRRFRIDLPQIGASSLAEVWRSRLPVQHGWEEGPGRLAYAHNSEVLLGHLHIDTQDLTNLEGTTRIAYERIDALLHRLGYPFPLRMWNFLPHINHGQGDAERYRQFSQGRFNSLAVKPEFESALPAATAIGTQGNSMSVSFLAARAPGEQVENPRQVSAFHYPAKYGPTSPSFSRANLKHWTDGVHLFVSGTASVVGHQSLHPNDPLAQLDETHRNIQALLENANSLQPSAGPFRVSALKIFVRHTEDWPLLLPRIRERFGAQVPLLALTGDICRRDLLLEIEGLFTAAPRRAGT